MLFTHFSTYLSVAKNSFLEIFTFDPEMFGVVRSFLYPFSPRPIIDGNLGSDE
jgi:hypothetical protein